MDKIACMEPKMIVCMELEMIAYMELEMLACKEWVKVCLCAYIIYNLGVYMFKSVNDMIYIIVCMVVC